MDLIDTSILQRLTDVDFNAEPVIFCRKTTTMENGKRKPRVILCTDFYIRLYKAKKGPFQKKPILKKTWGIWQLQSLNSSASTRFELQFKNDELVTFTDNETVKIARALATHLMDVSPEPKLNCTVREITDGLCESHNAFAKCVAFQAAQNDQKLSQQFVASVSDLVVNAAALHVMGADATIDLGKIAEASSYRKNLFTALAKSDVFTKLVLPDWGSGKSAWEDAGFCFRQNRSIRELECQEEVKKLSFDFFVKDVRGNPKLPLETVVLSGELYDAQSVEKVMKLVEACPRIKTLKFVGGLTDDGIEALAQREDMLQKLEAVWFERVAVPLDVCVIMGMNLKKLVVRNSGWDVADFIVVLLMDGLQLEEIDASYNTASRSFEKGAFPQTLSSFIVSNVEWNNNNLVNFMELLETQNFQSFKLDISSAKMSEEDWERFDIYVGSHGSAMISEFVYNENRISGHLVKFLTMSPSLRCLRARGSLGAANDHITEFCSYISRSPVLDSLYLQGTKSCRLGNSTQRVLMAAKSSKALRCLDISDQEIGAELIPMLENFFESNQTVVEIIIDGNKLIDIQRFQAFIKSLRHRRLALDLHVPQADMLAATEKNLTLEKLSHVMTQLQKLRTGLFTSRLVLARPESIDETS